jgi:hypothetical protein
MALCNLKGSLPPALATMWCAVGYMLENPADPPLLVPFGSSDNVRGADDQQERLSALKSAVRILRDHTPTISSIPR